MLEELHDTYPRHHTPTGAPLNPTELGRARLPLPSEGTDEC